MFSLRFKPVSNQADWLCNVQMTDKATGELLDLTGGSAPLTWTIEARLVGRRPLRPWLAASSTDGSGALTVAGLGILKIWFPVAQMQSLEPGSYEISLIVTNGAFTRQMSLGLLPVVGREISISTGYAIGGSWYG
jgi:hypothetical protein